MVSRLEALKSLVAQNPADTFSRYGLAMEYARAGDLEKAWLAYRDLLAINADYAPAYYHGGQVLERMGRIDEARDLYAKGIELTKRKGDAHACSELQAALDLLG